MLNFVGFVSVNARPSSNVTCRFVVCLIVLLVRAYGSPCCFQWKFQCTFQGKFQCGFQFCRFRWLPRPYAATAYLQSPNFFFGTLSCSSLPTCGSPFLAILSCLVAPFYIAVLHTVWHTGAVSSNWRIASTPAWSTLEWAHIEGTFFHRRILPHSGILLRRGIIRKVSSLYHTLFSSPDEPERCYGGALNGGTLIRLLLFENPPENPLKNLLKNQTKFLWSNVRCLPADMRPGQAEDLWTPIRWGQAEEKGNAHWYYWVIPSRRT